MLLVGEGVYCMDKNMEKKKEIKRYFLISTALFLIEWIILITTVEISFIKCENSYLFGDTFTTIVGPIILLMGGVFGIIIFTFLRKFKESYTLLWDFILIALGLVVNYLFTGAIGFILSLFNEDGVWLVIPCLAVYISLILAFILRIVAGVRREIRLRKR